MRLLEVEMFDLEKMNSISNHDLSRKFGLRKRNTSNILIFSLASGCSAAEEHIPQTERSWVRILQGAKAFFFFLFLSFISRMYLDRGQLPLKVRYVEFNFDVSVDCVQWRTVTSKSNLMKIAHLHAIIRPY